MHVSVISIDQLTEEIDVSSRGYQRSVDRISRFPDVVKFCEANSENSQRIKPLIDGILDVYPMSDSTIRGIAVLDLTGTAIAVTERQLLLKNLSYHSFFKEALKGNPVISYVYIAKPEVNSIPTIAYLERGIGL